MDSLTHAFVITLSLPASTPSLYLFAMVLGAIIPDIDILFKPLSDSHPSLFILTHGGFTHSFAGAVVIAGLAWFGIILGVTAGACPYCLGVPPVLILVIFSGICTHIVLDSLAFPGIPLLYPLSLKKFTIGIFPGPSIVLFAASIIFALIMAGGAGSGSFALGYIAFFIIFILLSAGIRSFVRIHTRGIIIPTFHPFRWLVIRDENASYILEDYDLVHGISFKRAYAKSSGLDPGDLLGIEDRHEVRRHRFYSYIVTSERTNEGILFQDPLRKERILFYPPFYIEVTVPDKVHEKTG
ncbi:MAG: metal-dependent hydrolase [Methanoregulaceae archaeon]|nr:metal-dependent hydrolase [Methanoregulaceae archaeon]